MAQPGSKERARLRAQAHALKPVLQIGREGTTSAVARTIEDAFNTRELLKVRVLESAPDDARTTADALAGMVDGAHVVQVIGRTIVLYRERREQE